MITAADLRERRLTAGLTQAELADILGVAVRSIRNWEASGVPARRTEAVRAALPESRGSKLHDVTTGAPTDDRIRIDQQRLGKALDAIEFFREAAANGASGSVIKRGVSAVVASLRGMGVLDLLDRETRQGILDLLTWGISGEDAGNDVSTYNPTDPTTDRRRHGRRGSDTPPPPRLALSRGS